MDRRLFLTATGALSLVMTARAVPAVSGALDELSDLAILQRALALHPGLYRYNSPDAVERALAELAFQWDDAPALADRYLSLSRFLAQIRCGHSYCNFYNQRKAIAGSLFDRTTRLPFHFVWIGDAMVVTDGFASGLSHGSIVTRLNGEVPAALRGRLLPYVRADGHNDAKRISLLEVRGDDTYETFDIFQGLIAPPTGGVHRVTAELPDGTTRELWLPAIDLGQRRAQMPAALSEGHETEPSWQWAMGANGIAVLTMPGWALWNAKWDWRAWLDERLDSLAGARGLIVDLRDNEGGEACGDALLARMIDRPYTPARIEQRLRFDRTPPDLDPFLDTWDDGFRTLGAGAARRPDGFYLRPGAEDLLTILPASKRITCPVRVLTSPVNSSATFQFAGDFRAIGAGLLVGRTTGGNRRGINGGCFFFVRLPQSGIEFDLPLVGYFPFQPEPDAGIVPDIVVETSVTDIAEGRDATLQAATASILAA